ncbi:DUF2000 domain-containing protein [Asanoa iriomotensis]|uniref:DUF2000 domain-containing protein n=1 Tax=Asanoa iriomotensis TaxID=234613 RepID=A0ABQ4CB61_9ACTN|nr:DUF2000 domain-containing protein [Asanoa iriomotensis]GIF60004.1 hypothetical protein Air01nite_60990 [Asanoa iriomotensis]
MRFNTKIAVLLRDDLAAWQRLNVTAFLVSGIAGTRPETIGQPYADADGTPYLPMFRQPVMVYAGDAALLTAARERTLRRGLTPAVFTADLFATGNDADNRAAVAAVHADKLDLVGIAVYGPRADIDKIFKGATLHP